MTSRPIHKRELHEKWGAVQRQSKKNPETKKIARGQRKTIEGTKDLESELSQAQEKVPKMRETWIKEGQKNCSWAQSWAQAKNWTSEVCRT